MTVGVLPAGARGLDCNTRVVEGVAKLFYAAGYRFAVRYVRRDPKSWHDISLAESMVLREAGLSIMLVQHVAPSDWKPTAQLGRKYGEVAAREAISAGYPDGATLWCDLEEVAPSSSSVDVAAYCNAWYDQAKAGGFTPGLYVGDQCGLSARQLYQMLRFSRYWAAYNLDADNYPAVRGVQMRQYEYPGAGRIIGVPFEYDVNVIQADAKGDTAVLWLPSFDL